MSSRIAAIQMCSSNQVDENLKQAGKLISEAAQQGAKLIVLPEMFAVMGDKLGAKERFGEGQIQAFLAEQARQHHLWVVGGTIPIACEHVDKVRAACLVFDETGACVARYDKIHLFDVVLSEHEAYQESETIEPGGKLVLVDTPVGRVGLGICYDIRFPELFRCLFNQGAEIIILPTAFTEKTGQAHWEVLARSRAIENFCYFVGACQGGTHPGGRKTYGHSLIIEPWGEIISQKESIEPGVIYADIDLTRVSASRKAIPVEHHQRIFCDFQN